MLFAGAINPSVAPVVNKSPLPLDWLVLVTLTDGAGALTPVVSQVIPERVVPARVVPSKSLITITVPKAEEGIRLRDTERERRWIFGFFFMVGGFVETLTGKCVRKKV